MNRINVTFKCLVCMALAGSCQAQHEFNFVDSESDNVLAVLNLARLDRVELDDVAGLAFTPAGDELFGYSGLYTGGFEEMRDGSGAHWFYSELDERLTGRGDGGSNNQASLWDLTPQVSSFEDVSTMGYLRLIAGDAGGSITLTYFREDGTRPVILRTGEWQPVPEPAAGAVSVLLCALPFLKRQRRKS